MAGVEGRRRVAKLAVERTTTAHQSESVISMQLMQALEIRIDLIGAERE